MAATVPPHIVFGGVLYDVGRGGRGGGQERYCFLCEINVPDETLN